MTPEEREKYFFEEACRKLKLLDRELSYEKMESLLSLPKSVALEKLDYIRSQVSMVTCLIAESQRSQEEKGE